MSGAVMKTDQSLREIDNDMFSYAEGWYLFTMMGRPSPTKPAAGRSTAMT